MEILLIPPKNLTDRILHTDPSALAAEKNYQSDSYREIRICLGNAIDSYIATTENFTAHVRTAYFIKRLVKEHTAGTIEFVDPVDIAKQVVQDVAKEIKNQDQRNWHADKEFKIQIKNVVRRCGLAVTHSAYDSYELDMLYFAPEATNLIDIHPIEKLMVSGGHSLSYIRTFYV